jgi:glycosyltransferase involved in cell wall biosynthesis
VGMVARLDPVKNHENFLRAAAFVAAAQPRARFACVGGGAPGRQETLERLARELGLEGRIVFTGSRRVTRADYSAFDVSVLASDVGEGFPNVLAEAMACGRPVAATDSGDARAVVGSAGAVVPPRDPEALAKAILDLLGRMRSGSEDLAGQARARILHEYSQEVMVQRSAQVLDQIMGSTRAVVG